MNKKPYDHEKAQDRTNAAIGCLMIFIAGCLIAALLLGGWVAWHFTSEVW